MRKLLITTFLISIGLTANAAEKSQIFTTSGIWQIPTGVTVVHVTFCGGGNGGAGGYPSGGGGGGGGASNTVHDRPLFLSGSGSLYFNVGTGGNGGAVGTPGLSGTVTSIFGPFIGFPGTAHGMSSIGAAQPGTANSGGKGGDGSAVGGSVRPMGGAGATSSAQAKSGEHDMRRGWYQTVGAAGGGGGFGSNGGANGGSSEPHSVAPSNNAGSSGGTGGASTFAKGGQGGDGEPGYLPEEGYYCAGAGGGSGGDNPSPGGRGGDGILILRWFE